MNGILGRLLQLACIALVAFNSAQAQVARIIGGQGAAEGEWPWMVSIFPAGRNPAAPFEGHFCGGALIAPQYVVTAAHCVADFVGYADELEVVVGRTRLSSSSGSRSLVQSVVVHPDFNSFLLRNDIALLKLTAPVPQLPIDLILPGEEALWAPGTLSTIIGWGQTDPIYPILPDLLQEAVVPVQSDTTCQNNLGLLYSASAHMCAGQLASFPGAGDGIDACNGDSGSPLMVPNGLGWKLAGLTSWGFECASHATYGVYTRVASYAAWAYSFPPAPPYVRQFPSLAPYDFPLVGTQLTCLPGTWSGDNLQFFYQWFRVGESQDLPISGAQSATYTLSEDDSDTYVYCLVTASNSSGVANGVTDWVGPVFGAEPTPFPTIAPLDFTGPFTSKQKAICKKKKCQVEMNAEDDQSSIAGVEGTVLFEPKGCGSSGSKACAKARRARILDAIPTDSGTWMFSFKVKFAGNGQVIVRGRDTLGNIQIKPTKVKFKAS